MLSRESSAEPGKWMTSRAEYQRGIMDAGSDPRVETVIVMSAAQVGKTEILNNVIGFYIQHDPSPILLVQPTLEMAEAWSKDRLAPMIRDTPSLQGKVRDPRSRDSNNTLLHKVFPGGHITTCGANSPASLASRPIRVVGCDEVDRYPASAGPEGDPLALVKKRTATFWNRKVFLMSTPTVKGASRIEVAYQASDQRLYFVPCPHCGRRQVLRWAHVRWEPGDPETARYECEACGQPWNEAQRLDAIRHGGWVATATSHGIAGFHLPGLYSPWVSLAEAVREFLEAKKLPETLRVWVNTYLGETWEDQGEQVDDVGLYDRREDYETDVPRSVVVLTAGVDVQDDRLECELVGWGRYEESWSLDYRVFHGDPAGFDVWRDLDVFLTSRWTHPDGRALKIATAFVDSGGHHTQAVYSFCKPREALRIYACKGVGGEGRPLIGRPSKNNKGKIKLFALGVDTAKELIYARLKIKEQGPGYCHFPKRYDEEYFRQITAEKVITRYHRGFAKRVWEKKGRMIRNEALDCRVYALAAFALLGTNINKLADRIERRMRRDQPEPEDQQPEVVESEPMVPDPSPVPPARRKPRPGRKGRGGFVNSWRF